MVAERVSAASGYINLSHHGRATLEKRTYLAEVLPGWWSLGFRLRVRESLRELIYMDTSIYSCECLDLPCLFFLSFPAQFLWTIFLPAYLWNRSNKLTGLIITGVWYGSRHLILVCGVTLQESQQSVIVLSDILLLPFVVNPLRESWKYTVTFRWLVFRKDKRVPGYITGYVRRFWQVRFSRQLTTIQRALHCLLSFLLRIHG